MKKFFLPVGLFFATILQTQAQQGIVEEAIRQDQYNKHGKAGEDKLNGWLNNMMNKNPQPEYSFPLSLQQHIVTYKNGKVKDEADMRTYVNSDKKQFAFDGNQMAGSKKKSDEKSITVFDYDSSLMVMYNITKKTVFAMNLNAFRSAKSQEAGRQPSSGTPQKSDMTCNKTGKTKQIMGYTCYETECTSTKNKGRTSFWTTTELKLDEKATSGNPAMAGIYGGIGNTNGAVLEINSYNENGELQTTMTVTDINTKETFKITSSEFQQQGNPGVNFGG